MAKIIEWTEEQKNLWEEWVSTRPKVVQDMCRRFPGDRLYKYKGDKRVTIYSYAEDGTVTVNITGEYNLLSFSRQVFGINPEDLEECDLPLPSEVLGCLLELE
jgi:hypothetical protein